MVTEHIGRITGDDHLVAILEGGDLATALRIAAGDPACFISRAMQDLGIVGEQDETATAALERTEPGSITPAKQQRGDPSLGSDQPTGRGQQGALESQPGIFFQEAALRGRLAGGGTDSADIGIFPGQQRVTEIGDPPVHQNTGATGPERNEIAVIENQAPGSFRPLPPDHGSIALPDAVGVAVIGAKIEFL